MEVNSHGVGGDGGNNDHDYIGVDGSRIVYYCMIMTIVSMTIVALVAMVYYLIGEQSGENTLIDL